MLRFEKTLLKLQLLFYLKICETSPEIIALWPSGATRFNLKLVYFKNKKIKYKVLLESPYNINWSAAMDFLDQHVSDNFKQVVFRLKNTTKPVQDGLTKDSSTILHKFMLINTKFLIE